MTSRNILALIARSAGMERNRKHLVGRGKFSDLESLGLLQIVELEQCTKLPMFRKHRSKYRKSPPALQSRRARRHSPARVLDADVQRPRRPRRKNASECTRARVHSPARSHPKYLGNVRYWVNSGKHLLALSFSGFDRCCRKSLLGVTNEIF